MYFKWQEGNNRKLHRNAKQHELRDTTTLTAVRGATHAIIISLNQYWPIPVAVRFKLWVCCSLAGSNPAGDMDVWLLWVLFVVRQSSLRRAAHRPEESYRVRCVYASVIVKPRQGWSPGPVRAVASRKKQKQILHTMTMFLCCLLVHQERCI
jgi:hypothetical protein